LSLIKKLNQTVTPFSIFKLFGLLVLAVALLLSACAHTLRPVQLPERQAAWESLSVVSLEPTFSHFAILNNGPEALRWRLALIDSATRSIDAQYFIWKLDIIGSLLLDHLLEAADRGVRVRLLLDNSFLSGETHEMLEVDLHPNVEMRIFNPFQLRSSSPVVRYLENLNDFNRINHRMHNKILSADNQVAIVSGRNIADEYFGFNKRNNFRDFDLITSGPIVPEISKGFDTYWNSGWAFPIDIVDKERLDEQDLVHLRDNLTNNFSVLSDWLATMPTCRQEWSAAWKQFSNEAVTGHARILQDDPAFTQGEASHHVAAQLQNTIRQSQKTITIITAYLIPTDGLSTAIDDRYQQGIRMLTNSLASTNHIPAHTAYRHRRKTLLELGVYLYEFKHDALDRSEYQAPGVHAKHFGLHAKVAIFDDRCVLIGSLNLDPRSLVLNTELGLLIDSQPLAKAVATTISHEMAPYRWRLLTSNPSSIIKRQGFGSAFYLPSVTGTPGLSK